MRASLSEGNAHATRGGRRWEFAQDAPETRSDQVDA